LHRKRDIIKREKERAFYNVWFAGEGGLLLPSVFLSLPCFYEWMLVFLSAFRAIEFCSPRLNWWWLLFP
jgi:hypothetical protein